MVIAQMIPRLLDRRGFEASSKRRTTNALDNLCNLIGIVATRSG